VTANPSLATHGSASLSRHHCRWFGRHSPARGDLLASQWLPRHPSKLPAGAQLAAGLAA